MNGQETAMPAHERTIYSIGHSNHEIAAFLGLLRGAGISAVADVRSSAFSRRHPQFNQPDLKDALKAAAIDYVYLGDQLGARPKDLRCYRAGRAEYGLIAATDAFREGLRRVEDGAGRYRIALMCAEREPLDCHRTILVARHLQRRGARIFHILADGTIEPNEQTELRLVKMMRLETGDLFGGPRNVAETIDHAYDRRGREICYADEMNGGDEGSTEGTAA
jgi:uncharacterized protein (DUF488 family)